MPNKTIAHETADKMLNDLFGDYNLIVKALLMMIDELFTFSINDCIP